MTLNYGLLIGRFNPPHIGHISLINNAVQKCDKLLIIVGSDLCVRTNKNIFFSYERIEMLKLCFNSETLNKLIFDSISDCNNNNLWTNNVKELVNFHFLSTNNITDIQITLFGFEKDKSSYYLKLFPEYNISLLKESFNNGLSSTDIRKQLCGHNLTNDNVPFYIDNDKSKIDIDNLHPNVCNWIKNNINNINEKKLNKNITNELNLFLLNKIKNK